MQCNRLIPATPSSRPKSRPGFSLVELLVVVGILAVLVSILVPVVSRAKKQARNVQCLANLRSLETALIGYINTNRHSVLLQDDVKVPGQLYTWEGNLEPMYANPAVRLCPEATEPTGVSYGSASQAYGKSKTDPTSVIVPKNPAFPGQTTNSSYGSYGINGYLYYPDPSQRDPLKPLLLAPTYGGIAYTPYTPANYMKHWFEDVTTLDGGDVPATVTAAIGGPLPPGFGGSGSVPAFGDCNFLDSYPVSTSPAAHDNTPTVGKYSLGSGDTSGKGKGMLGRFCLARHPHGVNIVFLDGHAATVPWAELWRLRWNKAFVPVTVTDALFNDN